jgi:hypothetical protein
MEPKKTFFDRPFVAASTMLGLALIIALAVLGGSLKSLRANEKTISVTGSAKQRISSDVGKFRGSYSRQTTKDTLATGYTQMAGDKAKVSAFLKEQGVLDEEVRIDPVSSYEEFDYSNNGVKIQSSERIILRQSVTVTSTDLAKIKKVADAVTDLSKQGIFFEGSNPEYIYSSEKLAQIRIELLSGAIKDAKQRADVIAEATGSKVSRLSSSSSGVVQLLAPDSVNVEDYGSYDTSTVDKDVMVTVKAQFEIK